MFLSGHAFGLGESTIFCEPVRMDFHKGCHKQTFEKQNLLKSITSEWKKQEIISTNSTIPLVQKFGTILPNCHNIPARNSGGAQFSIIPFLLVRANSTAKLLGTFSNDEKNMPRWKWALRWRRWWIRCRGAPQKFWEFYLGVSKNNGTPKSSLLIGFSLINHPFCGTPIFGNTHLNIFVGFLVSSEKCPVFVAKKITES